MTFVNRLPLVMAFLLALVLGLSTGSAPAHAADPTGVVKTKTQRMSDATLNSTQNGWYSAGSKLALTCYKRGQAVKGYFSSSFPGGWDDLWYKVSDGYFVADIDIETGSNNPVAPLCSTAPAPVAPPAPVVPAPVIPAPVVPAPVVPVTPPVSKPTAAALDTNSWYTISPKVSGLLIDVTSGASKDGTALQQFASNSTASQKFRFVDNGDGTFRVVSALDENKVWDVSNGNAGNGGKAQLWTWSMVNQQRWSVFNSAVPGFVSFVPKHSTTRCLDVPGGSIKIVQLQIYDCNNTASQQFALTKVGAVSTTKTSPGQIGVNVTLNVGDSVVSPSKKYTLVQQSDGNLVLYGPSGALWANSIMRAGAVTVMQGDGNLVSYQGGAARWASGTNGKGGNRLVVQDDGNVVIYTAAGKAVWSTNTVQGNGGAGNSDASMPKFRLPFESGQRWQAGAPHTNGANAKGQLGSIDLGPIGGASGRVVTIADGTVVKIICSNSFYLGVDHGNGWMSGYYHLTNVQTKLIGNWVPAGTYLGDAGQALPCAGSANFPQVHLTIFKNGNPIAISGVSFSGFTVYSGGREYFGYWNNSAGKRAATSEGSAACCVTAP